jgi:uncharacterized protein YifN (PemK superfamily)
MWCAFSEDAPLPEFRGEHPVIVVQSAKDLKDTCVVIPMTSVHHNAAPTVYKLKRQYNPAAKGVDSWAICSHLYTVSQSRLRPFQHRGYQAVPKISDDDLDGIVACIRAGFPRIFAPPQAVVAVEETVVVQEVVVAASLENPTGSSK